MYVIASSVFILFVLIFLGFFIGKGGIVRKECAPDLSNLVLKVTMPVTVFCSIISQRGSGMAGEGAAVFAAVGVMHAVCALIGILAVRLFRIPDKEKGVWVYSLIFTNNGFMGLPLALAIFGNSGMFVMAMANVMTNLLIFSLGVKLITWKYGIGNTVSLKRMLLNNINIAVLIGAIFCLFNIPLPELFDNLLEYVGDITSGLSMITVGLSLSRLPIRDVFTDKKMFGLAGIRLLVLPLALIGILRLLPFSLGTMSGSILLLTAALPVSSAQSMIAEQYGANTAATGRAVFITTLFSVATVPLIMFIGL